MPATTATTATTTAAAAKTFIKTNGRRASSLPIDDVPYEFPAGTY